METLPPELVLMVMKKMSLYGAMQLGATSPRLRSICVDDSIWEPYWVRYVNDDHIWLPCDTLYTDHLPSPSSAAAKRKAGGPIFKLASARGDLRQTLVPQRLPVDLVRDCGRATNKTRCAALAMCFAWFLRNKLRMPTPPENPMQAFLHKQKFNNGEDVEDHGTSSTALAKISNLCQQPDDLPTVAGLRTDWKLSPVGRCLPSFWVNNSSALVMGLDSLIAAQCEDAMSLDDSPVSLSFGRAISGFTPMFSKVDNNNETAHQPTFMKTLNL